MASLKAGKIILELFKARALAVAVVLMVIMPITLGGFAGFFLDKALGTMPIFFLVLLTLGVIASARAALKFKL